MRLKFLCLAAASFLPFAPAWSQEPEVIVITGASAPATSAMLPTKGMTKTIVARDYGQPATRHAPVGGGSPQQPPITRWDYDGFSVFFEHEHVVDAVQRGNPAPIAVYDGLSGGPRP